MFAAPNETLNDWQRDLRTAVELGPQHISTYGLTYEKGTRFWGELNKNRLREVDDELQCAMYEWTIDELTGAGYEHYEISNFARPGYRCRHNETYWRGQPYFAVGPGASRYVNRRRETNHRSTSTYLRRVLAGESPVVEAEQLNAEDRARERLVFGLRLLEGVNVDEFAIQTGISPETLAGEVIARYRELGLLEQTDGNLRLTRAGLLLSDSLWPELL
jgi:oxygen-independent coproporphyrinogen-3 oxidase